MSPTISAQFAEKAHLAPIERVKLDWAVLDAKKFAEESDLAAQLPGMIDLPAEVMAQIDAEAVNIVRRARKAAKSKGMMESFLEEFGLSNNEGLALMCLAESLLRVPDGKTADRLIAEKIKSGDWAQHKGQSDSWLVNASTWGLMLTGSIVEVDPGARKDVGGFMKRLTRKAGEPVIRKAMMRAMKIMGEQFVVGRTIDRAIARSAKLGIKGGPAICSFDMLGEGARTDADARRYFEAYLDAIKALGAARGDGTPETESGISVKLSALHPRYEAIKAPQVWAELYPRLRDLAVAAAKADINFCMDAEESDRLVISLEMLDALCDEPELGDWTGLGLALQAYQKRAPFAVDALIKLAQTKSRRLMIRLVKGAYWDSEIKLAQIEGHTDFPVWTRKTTTDMAYIACARKMLAAGDAIYPQFATHNAHTVAAIQAMAGAQPLEFQRLHGMGDALYDVVETERPCRIYAPVGRHEDLLPYLVRRLLENGANTSFVHSFLDDDVAPEDVAKSPFSAELTRHHRIAPPPQLFADRKNSKGLDLSQYDVQTRLEKLCKVMPQIAAKPLTTAKTGAGAAKPVLAPFNDFQKLGTVVNANAETVLAAMEKAQAAFPQWDGRGGPERAKILLDCADKIEANMEHFVALMALEAGKIFADSVAEVREAVDFLRYYARQAEAEFGAGVRLPGPAGETNHLALGGRGVFGCISPWNFPLAIFLGQIAAALAAGNTVLAKPAEQTPLTAYEAVRLCFDAGLPRDVLHLLPGEGDIGAAIVRQSGLAGVCFTGSTEVAQVINRALAAKDGPIPVLIAETGGLNGMFVDTTALKEQVVDDVIASAFNAAGQRCSALRVLFLPVETADEILETLKGAMDELTVGSPISGFTDIGPVIDAQAHAGLTLHLEKQSRILHRTATPDDNGHYIAPALVEIDSLTEIERETFGPILHVLRYKRKDLDGIMAEFAAKGYGLTCGVHSRLETFAARVARAVPAGNLYVNRNTIGAVVGVQPFGGLGLSGTGPKAGGPHYLHRFATERTVTINITAQGGDPELLNLE